MPYLRPVWIIELMRKVFASRIRFAMAGVTTSISYAATSPFGLRGRQRLAQDADDRHRELRADLLLLVRGEHVDDAVHRALGTGRVQRAEHDVARFGGGDRRLNRFEVAHFAHEDHVGVHPQGTPEGLGEARHIDADFPLVHRAHLVLVVVLDRVFERDDVLVFGAR